MVVDKLPLEERGLLKCSLVSTLPGATVAKRDKMGPLITNGLHIEPMTPVVSGSVESVVILLAAILGHLIWPRNPSSAHVVSA